MQCKDYKNAHLQKLYQTHQEGTRDVHRYQYLLNNHRSICLC